MAWDPPVDTGTVPISNYEIKRLGTVVLRLRTIASFPARGRWSVFAKAFAKALTRALQEWPHRSILVRAYTPFHVRQQLLAHPAREPVRPQSRRAFLFDLPLLRAHEALQITRSDTFTYALSSF